MSRTTLIIISIIAIAIIVGFLWWYFSADSEGSDPFGDAFDFFGFPTTEDPGFDINGGEDQNGNGIPDGEEDMELPIMRQVTSAPVAGAHALIVETPGGTEENPATTTAVRFVERETGHIKEVDVTTMEERRLTNTTIPRVYKALWHESGERVILRYTTDDGQTIETFSARVPDFDPAQATSTDLTGEFLPRGIEEIAISHNDEELIYTRTIQEEATFVRADLDGTGRETIFTFPFTEWLIQTINTGELFLTSKPSFAARGYFYALNEQSGQLERIVGNAVGLTTQVSPNGEEVYMTLSTDAGMRSIFYAIDERETDVASFISLPEKCVWSDDSAYFYCGAPKNIPSGQYPDEWYQGVVSFNDTLWRADREAGAVRQIIDPANHIQRDVDITKPSLGPNGRYLIFTDKKDLSLWLVDLEGATRSTTTPAN